MHMPLRQLYRNSRHTVKADTSLYIYNVELLYKSNVHWVSEWISDMKNENAEHIGKIGFMCWKLVSAF